MAKSHVISSVVSVVLLYTLHVTKCVIPPEWSYFPIDGHLDLGSEDDINTAITLTEAFKLKDKMLTTLYISPNGAIRKKDYKRMSTVDPLSVFPKYEIFVYYLDHVYDGCTGCKFVAKVNPDQTTQDKIDRIIQTSHLSGRSEREGTFTGDLRRTLIATWYQAVPYLDRDLNNTFQAVLTSDGSNSYVIYTYVDLQFPNINSVKKDRYGAGIRIDNNHVVMLPGSMLDSTDFRSPAQLMCKSNTFIPGTWVVKAGDNFNYGDYQIVPSCSHCSGDESWLKTFPHGVQQCGTNNLTYDSIEALEAEICRSKGDRTLVLKHSGPCEVTNPTASPSTTPDALSCPRVCNAQYDPVCASDGKTYSNNCTLENAIQCEGRTITFDHNAVCGVDGNWGVWITTTCSVTCGNGLQARVRTCNVPAPSGNGLACELSDGSGDRAISEIKSQSCNSGACTTVTTRTSTRSTGTATTTVRPSTGTTTRTVRPPTGTTTTTMGPPIDCSVNNGGCSDGCSNYNGSSVCTCVLGVLLADRKTCDFTNQLFFGLGVNLKGTDTRGTRVVQVAQYNGYVLSVTHDYPRKVIFSAAFDGAASTYIIKYELNTHSSKQIATVDGMVQVITMDYTNQNLYYAHSSGEIRRFTHVHGVVSSIADQHIATLSRPRNILLHPCERIIFVTDVLEMKVYRYSEIDASLNVIASGLGFPNGLAIDSVNHKLYWGDAFYDVIEESNYDGSCRRTVGFTLHTHLLDMTFSDGKIYWTNKEAEGEQDPKYYLRETDISNGATRAFLVLDAMAFGIGAFVDTSNAAALGCNLTSCVINPSPTGFPPSEQNMYPYGPQYGDTRLQRGHTISEEFMLSRRIPMFGRPTNKLFISNMGVVTLDSPFVPFNATQSFSLHYPYSPIIAVYGQHLSTRFAGDVYVRQTTNVNETVRAFVDLQNDRTNHNNVTTINHVVVVTWVLVPYFVAGDYKHTFQLVIASDDINSYVIYNYHQLPSYGGVTGFRSIINSTCESSRSFTMGNDELVSLRRLIYRITNCTGGTSPTPTTPGVTTKRPGTVSTTTPVPRIGDCAVNNGGCSDMCITSNSSTITCSCYIGRLQRDGITCDFNNHLYISNNLTLGILYPGSTMKTLVRENHYVVAVSHDYSEKVLFYATWDRRNRTVFYKYDLRANSSKVLYNVTYTGHIDRMAYDYSSETIYFTSTDGWVRSLSDVIRATDVRWARVWLFKTPRAIVLDECSRVMFVTDLVDQALYSVSYATGTRDVIADGLSKLNALAIDRMNYKLYWGDAGYDVIEEANYDGSCRRTVHFLSKHHIFSMTYLNGSLYWTNWGTNSYQVRQTEVATGKTDITLELDLPIDIGSFVDERIKNCARVCQPVPLPTVLPPDQHQYLYPFTPAFGDSVLEKGHNVTQGFVLSRDISLFGKPTRKLYIDNRGVIMGDNINTSSLKLTEVPDVPVLIPFVGGLISTRFVGDVFFRETTNSTELNRAFNDFSGIGMTRVPVHLIVITWFRVGESEHGHRQNTFQVVVATTRDNDTYLMYNYDRLSFAMGMVGFAKTSCNISTLVGADGVLLVRNGRLSYKLPACIVAPPVRTTPPPVTGMTLYPLDGDWVVPDGDDSAHGHLHFQRGIPFLSRLTKDIYVNINGYVQDDKTSETQINIPNNDSNVVEPYGRDLITRGTLGKIYYRNTTKKYILDRAANDIRRLHDDGFYPQMAVIVTYVNVSSYSPRTAKHTFQLVLATDYLESHVIFLYKRLDSTGAITGFNEKTCNNFRVIASKYESHHLVRRSNVGRNGMFVYKLSQAHCRAADIAPIKFARLETLDTGLSMSYSILRHIDKKLEVVFVQVISGIYPSSSFLLNRTSFASRSSIEYIYNVIAHTRQSFTTQFMFVTNAINKTNALQYGREYFPSFSSRLSCRRLRFEQQMSQIPVIKVTGEVVYNPYRPSIGFTSLWLQNVGTRSFDVCYREMFSFSGPRSITVDYIAATDDALTMINGTLNEVGTKMYSGLLDTHFKDENERSCQTIRFKYRYHSVPYVFITAEDANVTHTEIIAWVNKIRQDHVVVCARSTRDEGNERVTDIRIHYVVSGDLDLCSLIKCPSNLECDIGLDRKPRCGCMKSCVGKDQMKICGTDFRTYNSTCELDKRVCDEYGINSTVGITMAYHGECKQYPYASGKVKLEVVPSIPIVFCKDVRLNKHIFHELATMHIILTVSWDNEFNKSIHDATGSWSENVRRDGFTACALVAGRHFFGLPDSPSVFWVAYQVGVTTRTFGLESGVLHMDTWYTGARCQQITLKKNNRTSTKVLLGVEHSKPNTYKDAMTTWIERSKEYDSLHNRYVYIYKACARELQNFDGLHAGIMIHYLALHHADIPTINEVNEIVFPKQYFTPKQPIPSVCKTTPINGIFPHLPNPTIIMTGANVTSDRRSIKSIFSIYDLSVWIEFSNQTHVTACLKAVRAGYNREEVRVSFAIFPQICEDGWEYHDGRCFLPFVDGSYNSGVTFCNTKNATLPIVDRRTTDFFIETLAGANNTWIGYTDRNKESSWVWESGLNSSYVNWGFEKPDGGTNENCAIVDADSTRRSWDDRPCTDINKVVCERGSQILERGCGKTCLNGGMCRKEPHHSFGKIYCVCAEGYAGDNCEVVILDITICRDAVIRDEPWRLHENKTSALRNESCDWRDLMSNTTWYTFKGQQMLEQQCTNFTCGHRYPGWLEGTHPSSVYDGVSSLQIYYYEHYCGSDYGRVLVRNCGNFYAYRFTYLPYWSCDYGVCMVQHSSKRRSAILPDGR